MSNIEDRRRALVVETVLHYWEAPSRVAYDGGSCFYMTNDGRKCAIGRKLTEAAAQWARGREMGVTGLWEFMPLELRERNASLEVLGDNFLCDLQTLHDDTDWGDYVAVLDAVAYEFPDVNIVDLAAKMQEVRQP